MIKNLSEKELGHSFFFSIKISDFEHALYLLQLGVSTNTSYFVGQDQLVYTISNFSLTKILLSLELLKLLKSMALLMQKLS